MELQLELTNKQSLADSKIDRLCYKKIYQLRIGKHLLIIKIGLR